MAQNEHEPEREPVATPEEVEARSYEEDIVARDPLVGLLTPGAKVRILMALMNVRGEKMNPTAICERAAVSRNAWYDHREELVETFGVIEEAEPAGNSPMYRVDMEHPIIQRLSEIRGIATTHRNDHCRAAT